jgi:hypothetical protein
MLRVCSLLFCSYSPRSSLCYSRDNKRQWAETPMLCLVRRKRMILLKVCNHEVEGTRALPSGCTGSFAILKDVCRRIHTFWSVLPYHWAVSPQCFKGLWCLRLQVVRSTRRITSTREEYTPFAGLHQHVLAPPTCLSPALLPLHRTLSYTAALAVVFGLCACWRWRHYSPLTQQHSIISEVAVGYYLAAHSNCACSLYRYGALKFLCWFCVQSLMLIYFRSAVL